MKTVCLSSLFSFLNKASKSYQSIVLYKAMKETDNGRASSRTLKNYSPREFNIENGPVAFFMLNLRRENVGVLKNSWT